MENSAIPSDIIKIPKDNPLKIDNQSIDFITDYERGKIVKEKLKFYKENNCKVTFRLLVKQEYFYSGYVKEIICIDENKELENSDNDCYLGPVPYSDTYITLKLDSKDILIEGTSNIDPLSIHPASYNPIRYFERENISDKLRAAVFERDNNECQIRMDGCTGNAEEIDHIIPVSKGGLSTIENLQASCKHCNRKKSNN
jgi:hypothetical protein